MSALLVGVSSAAQAHDVLVGTSPADGSTTAVVPARVTLTMNEPALAVGTIVIVTGPAGPVQTGAAALAGATITQRLQPGSPAGRYTVLWRATSGDGHPVNGRFSFTATSSSAEPNTTSTTTSPATATTTSGTRAAPQTPTTSTAASPGASTPADTSHTAGSAGGATALWWLLAAGVLLALLVVAILLNRKHRSTPRSERDPLSQRRDPPAGL